MIFINSKLSLTISLLLLCTCVYNIDAWMAHGSYHNDAHPGKCFISDAIIISPGEKVKTPNACSMIHCNTEDGMATITGCGVVGAPPGCEWGDYIDINAPFQECCARHLNCANGMTNETLAYHQMIINMFKNPLQDTDSQSISATKNM